MRTRTVTKQHGRGIRAGEGAARRSTNTKGATTTTKKRSGTRPRPSAAKARRERQIAAAAEAIRKRLGLDTLADRKRDSLDFHEISVAAIRDAIGIAFDAGWDAGYEVGALMHE